MFFKRFLAMFRKKIKEVSYFVHPTAEVQKGVSIGRGTKIWQHCIIQEGARIGSCCNLGHNVCIEPDVIIGNDVKIKDNVTVFEGVTIEDGVFLGPHCTTTNVINPRAEIERKHEFRPTLVEKGATVGANCTILCGVTIGRYAFLGAGSVITHSVGAHVMFYGNPAKPQGYVRRDGTKCSFQQASEEMKEEG